MKSIKSNLSCIQDKEPRNNWLCLRFQFFSTMSPHCGSLLSIVIGLLQIIIAMDHIISLSNQVYKNFLEAGNMWSFDFILALNIQKVLSFTQIAVAFFSHLAVYNSISRLGNFVKITFDSSCLNSKHVLFGCSKQLLVCSLAISRKNPSIWRTNRVATNIIRDR